MNTMNDTPRRELFATSPPGPAARRVLLVLLAAPPRLSGFTACQAAQAGTGAFYPLIWRLEQQGWVTHDRETVPYGQDRPPRRFYTMTWKGRERAAAALRLALPWGSPDLSRVAAWEPVPYPMGRADRRILLALLPGPVNATFGVLHWVTGTRWGGLGAVWFTAGLDRLQDHGWVLPLPDEDGGPAPCYWLAPGHRPAALDQLRLREAS